MKRYRRCETDGRNKSNEKAKAVKSRSCQERRSGCKKRKARICTIYYSKVIRMLEQNDVEQYFIHAYAEKLKVKFENATMITEEVIEYILEDMSSHFNTENVFERSANNCINRPNWCWKTTTLAKMAWQFHGKKKNGWFYYDRPFAHWNSAATARLRKDN